ncbi:SAL1 phosphatase AltName: Full=3'(2'),5'-bisphosphate nucleotidase 1; AltName: Full=3'(2'),5'-bisphosphonucleoside 3'(2')-phosphohydrolase 1; AltName: Full=DPNPase 1; AltName: Full=Inositol polyphosphate 1-phosphatase 1; Short=IPPase 1; AltName: Full=Inositol-1,4-bisphosphate 1-phosphatase 1; AltName: Full=Protein FIERY 1 [Serendipita indica DSM 11827]|uniref:3'(2'),5'-bisphosphate nucleotidase n=1 Tax=Serendipita indica (strain DSM 11827) TaxID=1109443 RepID=G4T552_SERID|nr:SAL1 phosphatase AltName: Full=3'(2'),5'-bisphosphate nucleotidase 1; AltName: Full=3'(2'),5'-bisphosphonucleoside 3'(2')-phosphohydrolase 1; AltName: Full=DPNPase 1; AltName: Full=Inositol polyphosphate 1-phosphatase 1; Short=IPPase 1; AltName: Full=Inositol-1,4-bisphosphate 1-phosphatase 1; AltName: Full=Protein FIERY 1 [Serendipita indica DSM 11827]CCA66445.1 probable MET22-protein ser/thr phosphatase [Serendipita indica DSM 11827]
MSLAFALEKRVAISAVVRACSLTSAVFQRLVKNETLTKGDKSPVTVADFSAQAVVNSILANAFPADPIVGEEDSADLRVSTAEQLRTHLTSLANDALHLPIRTGEDAAWGIGPDAPVRSTDELLSIIDRGNHVGGPSGRMWALDPIDGTKGFLRGGQYAVCLALIVDSVVQVGVMGCPNLPISSANPDGERGCIFVAVRGQGAEQRSLSDLSIRTPLIHAPVLPPLSSIALLESLEAAHSSHSFSDRLSKHLGLTASPLRMDSQAKYACLARGEGGIYFRMPVKGSGYREKIWDHASGTVLVEEAGAIVSDSRGEPLNFGLGITLGENNGIVACFKGIHQRVLDAVTKAQAEEQD